MSAGKIEALRLQARRAVAAGRLREAGDLLRRALSQAPRDAAMMAELGVVEAQSGRPAEGVALLRRAAALRPHDLAIRFNLGCLRRMLGQPEALADFEAVTAADPRHLGAWMNGADLHLAAGRALAAKLAYRHAATLAPLLPEPLFGIGRAAFAEGNFAEAESAYREALALAQGFVQAWIELGRVRFALGRQRDAEAAYRGAIRFAPDNPEALAALAAMVAAPDTGRGAPQ
ncbi:tetratricopeptide repeat protein [Desertibaculum subflavum]|uniref:tetratricopeptide repeat protein n=1 Tax=Desertibaculum subflavum TaxID=2268458 RepID=UPI000E661F1A